MKLLIGIIVVLIAADSLPANGPDSDPLLPIMRGPEAKPAEPAAGKPKSVAPADKPPTKTTQPPSAAAVEIDKEKLRLVVRGSFLGTSGLVELGATSSRRKQFLAVILLDAQPSEIARAIEDLGVQPGKVPVADPRTMTATRPEGRKVDLLVEWKTTVLGKTVQRQVRLEEFFWDRSKDKQLPESPWVYAGSSIIRGPEFDFAIFVADLSGSVATINRMDTSSLFYYGGELPPTVARRANPQLKPRAGTSCRLVIQVLADARPKADQPPEKSPASESSPAETHETEPPTDESPTAVEPTDVEPDPKPTEPKPEATEPSGPQDNDNDQEPAVPIPPQDSGKQPLAPESPGSAVPAPLR